MTPELPGKLKSPMITVPTVKVFNSGSFRIFAYTYLGFLTASVCRAHSSHPGMC